MKKVWCVLIPCLVFSTLCSAQGSIKSMTEAEQLGTMAGVALACNAGSRLDDYELISSYIIANKAPDATARKKLFKEYAAAKLRSYNLQKDITKTPCPEVLEHFYALPIFGAVIYKDGTIKMPDGKILKPITKAAAKAKTEKDGRNYMTPARRQ